MKKDNGKQWKVALISLLATTLISSGLFAGSGQSELSTVGWQDVLRDGFESDWPIGSWTRLTESGDYAWGRSDYTASEGSYSLWCAKKALNNAPSRYPAGNYANNMSTWAIWGPGDLRSCTAATISFDMQYLITDNDKVQFLVDCGNGWQGFTYSGGSDGWKHFEFDLSNGPWGNALWSKDVYIAFKFYSNSAVAALGAFVDNVVIEKYFTGWPNLAFNQLNFSPASIIKGRQFFINGVITNTEASASQSTQAILYISADNIVDPEVDLILGKVDIPDLQGGQSYSFSEKFFAPTVVPAGMYHIASIVDPLDYIAEESNDDNLIITDAKINLQDFSGWEVLKNDGFEGEFPDAGWTVNPGAGHYSWNKSTYKSFEGGQSIWCNGSNYHGFPNVYPNNGYALNSDAWAMVGPFDLKDVEKADVSFAYWQGINDAADRLEVLVSYGGGWQGYEYTTDSNGWVYRQLDLMNWPVYGSLKGVSIYIAFNFKSNNIGNDVGTFVDKVIVRRQFENPDLICLTLSQTPVLLAPGGELTIASSVKNLGSKAAGATDQKIYLSADATISEADVLLATNAVQALGINEEVSFSNTATLATNIAEGKYYIGAVVDQANAVQENVEDNNTTLSQTMIEVKVPTPDLICDAVSGSPVSLSPGSTLQVDATVKNIGDGTAGASQVKVVLSTDQTIDASDTELCVKDVPALDAGASASVTDTYVLPADLAAGTYYVGAIADVGGAVTERDETNNTLVSVKEIVVISTDVKSLIVPNAFALEQNYPNPFNPSTIIGFTIPKTSELSLVITNIHGQVIRILVDKTMQPGAHEVVWDGTNESGSKVASGVYFYTISSGSFKEMRKMIFIQ